MRAIKALLDEIGDRSYRVATGVSIVLIGWAWILTWIVRTRPSLSSLAVCLAVPYLAWTYLPLRLIQVFDLALAPGLLPTPNLPLFESTDLAGGRWTQEAAGSILLVLVSGALYAFLTRLICQSRPDRHRTIWLWTLAQGLSSVVTALYLFSGLLIEAYGRTPTLGVVSDIAHMLVYAPMQVVRMFYRGTPTLQQWGDWEIGVVLSATGLLAFLTAGLLLVPLLLFSKRHRFREELQKL